MRRIPCLLVLACLLMVSRAPRATATACDIPLIVGSVGTTANVLILLDNSMSMNEVVYHDAYNGAVNYSGNFNRTSTYTVSSDGNKTPRSFNGSWPNSPSAYLVNSDLGWSGWYIGNYLNWVYFHATAAQRAAIPNYTRIQAAKTVLNSVLTDVTSVRFAIERFNFMTGGTVIAPFDTPLATMQTQVNAIAADSWTPLAESMETALNYYKQTGAGAPIQAACQRSFVILITDGFPTQDIGVSNYLKANDCGGNDPGSCTSLGTGYPNSYNCSAYLDNVACYMYRNDLRADLDGIQNAATFVVGFTFNAPLLQVTANEGGGEYFTTSNTAGLLAALTEAFSTISKRVAAGTSVAVVSAEDRINNRLFRARYESVTWRGYVEAFNLPFQAGTPPLWEAGSLLAARNPDTRTIHTSTDGTSLVEFTAGNASSLMSGLGAADAAEASDIINYARGEVVSGTRDREGWILGDVVDASPVAVGRPASYSNLPGYPAFRAAHAGRTEVVYVGGNDGMLHCFNTSNGEELWGYVPKTQLPRLQELMDPSYCHLYFVNSTPAVYDMSIGGTWKTVLFAGEEPGRNGMYALDITDPTSGSASLIWDVDVPGLKGSSNTPTLIRDRNRNAQVLCVGTGFSASASGDTLIVLDPATGGVLDRIGLGSAVAQNKTTRAAAVDTDFDGYDDLLYIGDLAGRLWRVDLRTDPWTKTLLFTGSQPIQAPPVVTLDAMSRPMVFFGTGRFLVASDPTSTTMQTIYAIVDDGSGDTFTPANLVDQTSTFQALTTGTHGWYVDLVEGSGERVTRTAALINGTLYVVTYRPSAESCGGGGQSWLYSLDYKDGSAPDHANGGANNVTTGRTLSMGDGMLADPTVDLVNEVLLLQSSNAVVMSQSVGGGLKKLMVRGWRQKWN